MPIGLSAAQLAKMRADIQRLMPDTCVIQAVTRTPDGFGGGSESWSAVTGGTVSCRIDPSIEGSPPIILPEKEATAIQYVGTFPYDAPIAVNQRAVINGKTYEILRSDPDNSWNVSRRAYLTRVE